MTVLFVATVGMYRCCGGVNERGEEGRCCELAEAGREICLHRIRLIMSLRDAGDMLANTTIEVTIESFHHLKVEDLSVRERGHEHD